MMNENKDLVVIEEQPFDGFAALAVLDQATDLADSTRAAYKRAVEKYLETGGNLMNAASLLEYAETLPNSGRALLKAALRRITNRALLDAMAALDPSDPVAVSRVQGASYKASAIQEAITVRAAVGTKAHTWLSVGEVRRLLATCDQEMVAGQRDRLALGMLVAAGLRRSEACTLRFSDVHSLPVGGRFRSVLDVLGKGSKQRQVPISDNLAAAIESWGAMIGAEPGDLILRKVSRHGHLGNSISAQGLFNIVAKAGAAIGKPDLQAHDLRRTFAQIGYEAGIPLVQIKELLGHASIATTQRYLDLAIDLDTTSSDFVPF